MSNDSIPRIGVAAPARHARRVEAVPRLVPRELNEPSAALPNQLAAHPRDATKATNRANEDIPTKTKGVSKRSIEEPQSPGVSTGNIGAREGPNVRVPTKPGPNVIARIARETYDMSKRAPSQGVNVALTAAGPRPNLHPIPSSEAGPYNVPSADREPDVEMRPARQAIDDILAGLPPLPRSNSTRSRAVLLSFILVALVPTVAIGIYYFFVASNQYIAEFRFSVVQTNPILPGQPPPGAGSSSASSLSAASSLAAGLSSMVGMSSVSGAGTQNFIVVDYLRSREVLEELQKQIDVRELYSKGNVDWLSRFNSDLPMEDFVNYWQSMITADYDEITGLAVAQVRAFTPQDALLIVNSLVKLSEDLVNGIANRANADAVKFAQDQAAVAQERLKDTRAALTAFRNAEGIIDPTQSVVPTNVQQANTLEASLVALKTQLASLTKQQLDPDAPAVRVLRAQITATQEELDRTQNQVAVNRDGHEVLTDVMARYERLNLDVQFAQMQVVATMQALDQARGNAAAQHLYLTPYVRPILPTKSMYPRRLQSTLLAGVLCFGVWMVGLMAVRSIREHA